MDVPPFRGPWHYISVHYRRSKNSLAFTSPHSNILQRGSPILRAADHSQQPLAFARRRRPAQRRQVKLLDDVCIGLAGREQAADAVVGSLSIC